MYNINNMYKGGVFMQTNRANEIINSPKKIEVLYKNNSVWIENVDTTNSTANVKILDTNEILKVPVNDLKETDKVMH